MTVTDDVLAAFLAHIDRHDPGSVVGVYLYGSAASTGLRPDSDIDILVVTRRTLDSAERVDLVKLLLSKSGWRGHRDQFPEAADRRPLEVTFLTLKDLALSTSHPRLDFQYGEWRRETLSAGTTPEPTDDSDVVILLATALGSSRALRGVPLSDVAVPIPLPVLRQAVAEQVPDLLRGISGDERNVLLTLARMLVTVETGEIVSKDQAAQTIAARRKGDDRAMLSTARGGYLGLASDTWRDRSAQVYSLALSLADEILRKNAATTVNTDSAGDPT